MDFLETIVHKPVNVYPKEQEYIDNFILSQNFPWYWQGAQTLENCPKSDKELEYYNGSYLSHILLQRTENPEQSHMTRPTTHYSHSYEFFMEIFHRYMVENGLKYTKIYRANLNLNWHNPGNHTKPHKDHVFPHYNFIMYLTDCSKGNTLVWSDDFSASYSSPCKKNTAITFKELWHAHEYPEQGQRRVVFVTTYI